MDWKIELMSQKIDRSTGVCDEREESLKTQDLSE
jgi:hypothetical protein